MSTDRQTTRIVRSWLDEGVTKLPDRVLDAVLDQVPATPQRRSGWSAWRSYRMNTYLKLAAAAVAVIVVAFVGYQLLPKNGGIGGPGPSPTPSLLAKGTFVMAGGFNTVIDAARSGSVVSGSLTASAGSDNFTVVLECAETVQGVLWIAGDVTVSGYAAAPKGTRAGIVLKPGSPVQAIFVFQMNDPRAASCPAFLDGMQALEEVAGALMPITGTVELQP
jgi:hypothetical protein